MKILNLYAGIGGNRKLWSKEHDITAIEINPKIAAEYQKLYPEDTVIIADAHQYILDHYKEYDFIWSSPPCQSHSSMVIATRHDTAGYIDMKLWQEIIFLDTFYQGTWIVENVRPYYKPFIEPKLCVGRHCFWSNRYWFGINDIPRPKTLKNIAREATNAGKAKLMDWLGIHIEQNIYYNGNHCPAQIFRNAVHPQLGKQFLDAL